MSNFDILDSKQTANELGITLSNLRMWLSRNPEYRPIRRISGDDLLWTAEEIERVRAARAAGGKGKRKVNPNGLNN